LKVILHYDAEALAAGLFSQRSGAVLSAQEFRPDMDVHVDYALGVDARK
jgi:hypothetical protein